MKFNIIPPWQFQTCKLKWFFSWFLSSSTLEWERTEKGNVVTETWSLWGGGLGLPYHSSVPGTGAVP